MKQVTTKKSRLLCALMSSALILGMTNVSYAEEGEFSLDQVIVTATKTPIKEFEANANISVVTRKEIEQNHYQNLTDALRNVPGVTIQNYGGGVGYESSNWFRVNGSSNIVILIDGIRVNISGLSYPLKLINSMENIERIEVLKGAASALYGADAQGGVINIITRKVEGNKSTLQLTGGSYGKKEYSFMNQGTANDYSWLITAKKDKVGNYSDAHGYEVKQNSDADTLTLSLTKKLNDVSDLTFNYEKYTADSTYQDAKVIAEKDTQYGAVRYGTDDTHNWRLTYNYKPSVDLSNQFAIFSGVTQYDREYANSSVYDPKTRKWKNNSQLPYGSYYKTKGLQDQYSVRLSPQHLLTTGYEYTKNEAVSAYSGGKNPLKNKSITNQAFYLQDEWDMRKDWKLTSGVRYDQHSMFGGHTTPRINLGYKQDEHTNYYVAYSKFFVAPTLSQLYSGTAANPDLDAETGHSTEAGINHIFNETLFGDFHIYKRSSTGEITSNGSPAQYLNSGATEANGWEAQLTKKISKQLSVHAGYTYVHIDPNGGSTGVAENMNRRIPKGLWAVGMDYQQAIYDIHLQGRGVVGKTGYVPSTVSNPATTQCYPESTYWVWDLAANYKLTKNSKAFVKVNNLFDKFYVDMSSIYTSGAYEHWWTSPGRNYQIGVEYQF